MNWKEVNKDWTLFLDRDGVINVDKEGSYIFKVDEFSFYEGALGAMKIFEEKFGHIVVVTNQRGVGRGLMSLGDLEDIHHHMLGAVKGAGGRIDRIYFCTSLDNDHPDRKPNPGMALRARQDFPAIDFAKSIMVGNNISDMEFGRNAGMHTVFIRSTLPGTPFPHPAIDAVFDSLQDLAKALQFS